MKPLMLTLLLVLLPINAKADYWVVYTRYWSCGEYKTAPYKYKSLNRARDTLNLFRKMPKYKNCWIRLVRER